MRYKRAHVLLPEDLARDIDAIAGRRGRSKFLVDTAREAIRRQKLLDALEERMPAWKDSDRPDMSEGSAGWVRKLRKQSERGRARRSQKVAASSRS